MSIILINLCVLKLFIRKQYKLFVFCFGRFVKTGALWLKVAVFNFLMLLSLFSLYFWLITFNYPCRKWGRGELLERISKQVYFVRFACLFCDTMNEKHKHKRNLIYLTKKHSDRVSFTCQCQASKHLPHSYFPLRAYPVGTSGSMVHITKTQTQTCSQFRNVRMPFSVSAVCSI